MATGDIKAVSIRADGWSADVTIEGWSGKAGTITYDYGTPASGSGKLTFTVTSEGYNSSGVLGTIVRTVYGTKTVRQAYPNNALLDESDSGADIVVRVSLSDNIYNDDKNGGAGTSGVDPVVTASLGWANDGSSDTNLTTGLTVTNNSTLDYPMVIGQWDWKTTPAWKRCETDFKLGFRARHGFNIAAVTLSAVGVTSSHSQSATVTTLTKRGPEQNSLYHESYNLDVPITGYTQGEEITLKAIAYPLVGDASSILDTSLNTTATDDIRGLTKVTCHCDKTGALKVFAVVDTAGSDTTGATSTTLSVAEASPHLTIGKALANGATVIYMNNGSHDILGSNPASVAVLGYYREIRPHPSSTTAALVRGGTFRTYKATKLAYIELPISYASGNGWLDGEAGARRLLFEGCTLTATATPTVGLGYRSDGCWFVSCTGFASDHLKSFSSSRLAYSFTACTWSSLSTEIDSMYALIACDGNFGKTAQYFQEKAAANIAPDQNNLMIEHNQLLNLDTNTAAVFRLGSARAISDTSFVGNVIEVSQTTVTQPALWFGGDSATLDINNSIVSHNTMVGARCNLFYNDSGTVANVRNNVFVSNNALQSYNIKSDTFGTPSGNRVGNWAQLYGVGFKNNRYDGTASSSFTSINEFDGLDVSFVIARDTVFGTIIYTNDASIDGSGAGGGDYIPGSGSQLSGVTLLRSYMSFDSLGTAMDDDIGALIVASALSSKNTKISINIGIGL